jgi:long-chain acyl-CoA synthetase
LSATASRPGERYRWGSEVSIEPVLGAPCRVFTNRPRHAGDLLREGRSHADDLYLIQGSRRLSFGRHEAVVAEARRQFGALGVGPGDSILIVGANAIELVTTFWATLRAGATVVMGNAWWSRPEFDAALELVSPKLVVCDDKRGKLLGSEITRVTYDDLRAVSGSAPDHPDGACAERDEDDPAVVIFTSGTEGFAKGALLSHRSLIAGVQNLLTVTRRLPGQSTATANGSVSLLSLPLFHIGGLAQVTSAMATGGALVFNEGRFDPADVVALLKRERVRVWSAVPTMASRVVDHLEATGESVDSLRSLGMGGSAVTEHLRERVRAAFPHARRGISVTWGQTEAGGAVTTGGGKDLEDRPHGVGLLLPTSEARVDQPDPVTGAGELLVRTPSVMLGYLGAVASPVDDARWLRTGDIGWVDEDGHVYITDRLKDIIIRGGENIAAVRVEDEVARHPFVDEVAVVGLPDPELGEVVGAIVRLKPGTELDIDDLTSFLGHSLGHFEIPTKWWSYPEDLPKNATGKVSKRQLKEVWTALEGMKKTRDELEPGYGQER